MNNYKLPSYGKVLAIGHRAISDIFKGPVVIQEKVDGSQFSFGLINGELHARSKGQQLVIDAPEKMFSLAIEQIKARVSLLREGWIYRCEYLKAPKHNTLAYERTPTGNLVLFDAHPDSEGQGFTDPQQLRQEAENINVEPVPVLFEGEVRSQDQLAELLESDSILGGCKVEGVVAKNYHTFNSMDGRFCVGKFVSERFKEKHAKDWKKSNPATKDVVQMLIEELRTEARWEKAKQHLREAGLLEESPKDIGSLIKEVQKDVKEEEEDYIKEALFKHFWPQIQRSITHGLPEWYKEQVMKNAFNQ